MSNISANSSSNNLSAQRASSMQPTQTEFYIKALSGEFKGKVFKLTSKEIYVGRDKTNHISLKNDIKVSRQHARFIKSKGKLYIQDISSNNFIRVNNEVKKEAKLSNGYTVTIGQQNFKIIVDSKTVAPQPSHSAPKKKASSGLTAKQQKNLIIGAVITVVGLFVLKDLTSKKIKNKTLNMRDIATTERINERLDAKTKELETIETEYTDSEKSDPDFQSADNFYHKGFRQFQKGIYANAVSSFETALALYPEHRLARRYKNLAETRLDELIDFQMTEGRRHIENKQFDYCIAAYKNALSQIYDKDDTRYKEAKLGLDRCRAQQRSKY